MRDVRVESDIGRLQVSGCGVMPVAAKKARRRRKPKAALKKVVEKLPERLPLPDVLYMELFCNPRASRVVGNGLRCFKFIACDGRTLYATTILGEEVYLLVEGVILKKVQGCDHRISESGHLEIRTRGSCEYTTLCPWTFRDAAVPLIPKEDLVEFRLKSRRKKSGSEAKSSALLDDEALDFGL